MNANEFLELVKEFDQLDQGSYRKVLQLIQAYPFFLPPYIMAAKFENKASKGYSNARLHDAALRAPDRGWLKLLMERPLTELIKVENENQPVETNYENPPPSPQEGEMDAKLEKPHITGSQVSSVDGTAAGPQQTGGKREDILKKLEENLHRFKKKVDDDSPAPASLNIPEDEEHTGEEIIDSIKKKEKKELKDPIQLRQKDLIKKFNKKTIKISPVRENVVLKDLSISSTQPQQEIVSEPMASLLAKQNKIEEAIAMYEKLMLKFPDKKVYFADAIQKLEKKS